MSYVVAAIIIGGLAGPAPDTVQPCAWKTTQINVGIRIVAYRYLNTPVPKATAKPPMLKMRALNGLHGF